jgi:hypothetical protein
MRLLGGIMLVLLAGTLQPKPPSLSRKLLPSPGAIRERVAKAGAMNAVWDITQPNPETSAWPVLIKKVADGSKEWLEVAELLAPGTDAGYSLQLRFAVTRALAREPANVLGILDRVYAAAEVCGDVNVFMDSDSYAAAAAELARWTQGVTGVSDPDLRRQREACLKGLTHLRTELRKSRREWFTP